MVNADVAFFPGFCRRRTICNHVLHFYMVEQSMWDVFSSMQFSCHVVIVPKCTYPLSDRQWGINVITLCCNHADTYLCLHAANKASCAQRLPDTVIPPASCVTSKTTILLLAQIQRSVCDDGESKWQHPSNIQRLAESDTDTSFTIPDIPYSHTHVQASHTTSVRLPVKLQPTLTTSANRVLSALASLFKT